MNEQVDKLTEELDSRLDELFSEDDLIGDEDNIAAEPVPPASADVPPPSSGTGEKGSRISDLNAMLMSVEWEIDDHVMGTYLEEVERLLSEDKRNSVMPYYLKILRSLGHYIRKEKAAAHPDSIRLLKETQESLDHVLASENMEEQEQRTRFLAVYDRFDGFRKVIGCRPRSITGWEEESLAGMIRNIVREEMAKAGVK